MIKAVIFDLDGVILSTDDYHYNAWKAIADQEGIPFDREVNNRLRGVSRMASLNIILEKAEKEYSAKEKEALAAKKNDLYVESLKDLNPETVVDDVRQTIATLKEKGILLAIGSSSKNTKYILEQVGMTSVFDAIVDGTMISHSKPDPEVFLKAASLLNVSPMDAIVVEDAVAGVQAANAGGFYAVGIGDASTSSYADAPIAKISDLLGIVEKRNTPRLVIRGLEKVYPNGCHATKNFNLDVYDEEFVVFVGPSGCGKSTVLRMIAGLEEVTDGSIALDGEDITDKESKDRDIAMVFQNYALYPHMTVRKNIAFPLTIKHHYPFYGKKVREEINQKVEEAAEKIGLTQYLDVKPANLSGGQRQRVALGRAIVRETKCFLLDEPLSNLDAKMRVQMRSEITRLHDRLKTIFIYVTHDQVEAMTMGTKIVVLKDGVVQQIGSPEEIFINPVNQFVAGFIGTPQMNFLETVVTKDGRGSYKATFLGNEKGLRIPLERVKNFDPNFLGKPVIMGVRPKAISVQGDLTYDAKQNYSAQISLFEQLGEETVLYTKAAGKEDDLIISTTGLGRFRRMEVVPISFDLSKACFFSKEDGHSLI